MTSFKTVIASISNVYKIMLTCVVHDCSHKSPPVSSWRQDLPGWRTVQSQLQPVMHVSGRQVRLLVQVSPGSETPIKRPLQGFTPGLDPGSLLQGVGVSTFTQHGGAGRHTEQSVPWVQELNWCATTDVSSSDKWLDSGITLGSICLHSFFIMLAGTRWRL